MARRLMAAVCVGVLSAAVCLLRAVVWIAETLAEWALGVGERWR